jgi:hypothetical protein
VSLRFRTAGEDLVLNLDSVSGPNSISVTAEPDVYARVGTERLFGRPGDAAPVEPILADRAVQLTLRWSAAGAMPLELDRIPLAADDWRLLDATQEHDGIRVGYSTQQPERLAGAVLDFLAADGWEAHRSGGGPIRTRYAGTSGEFDCEIHTDEEREILVVVGLLPLTVASARFDALAEVALELTYRMDIGAVEITPRGEIRVRHGIDVEDVELTSQLVRNTIYPVVTQAERWLPVLRAVASGTDPTAALDDLDQQ